MNTFNFDDDFDFETFKRQALEKVKQGQPLTGKGGVLMPLIKDFFGTALEGRLVPSD